MALDTLGDLKTYIQRARRDSSGDTATYEHWTEAQAEDDINQAILAILDEVPLATVFGTFEQAPDASSVAEYVPPLGYDLDEIIHLQTGTRALTPKTPSELFALDSQWATRTGTPLYYVPNYRRDSQQRGVILVSPTPSAVLTDLKGEFTQTHPWLTTDTERTLLPLALRPAIAYGALHLGYLADKQETQDDSKARYWERKFLDAIARGKKKAARRYDRSPQTVTLQR